MQKLTIQLPTVSKINKQEGVIYIFRAFKIDNTGIVNDIDILFILETNDVHRIEKYINMLVKDRQYHKHNEIYEIDLNIFKSMMFDCNFMISKCRNMLKHLHRRQQMTKLKQIQIGQYKLYMFITKN